MSDKKTQPTILDSGFDPNNKIPENTDIVHSNSDLRGDIGSGMLFIGDPCYLAGDLSKKGSEAVYDPYRPFEDFEVLVDMVEGKDSMMNYSGSDQVGRGVFVNLSAPSGRYNVKKKIDKESGKVTEITITIKD